MAYSNNQELSYYLISGLTSVDNFFRLIRLLAMFLGFARF